MDKTTVNALLYIFLGAVNSGLTGLLHYLQAHLDGVYSQSELLMTILIAVLVFVTTELGAFLPRITREEVSSRVSKVGTERAIEALDKVIERDAMSASPHRKDY